MSWYGLRRWLGHYIHFVLINIASRLTNPRPAVGIDSSNRATVIENWPSSYERRALGLENCRQTHDDTMNAVYLAYVIEPFGQTSCKML